MTDKSTFLSVLFGGGSVYQDLDGDGEVEDAEILRRVEEEHAQTSDNSNSDNDSGNDSDVPTSLMVEGVQDPRPGSKRRQPHRMATLSNLQSSAGPGARSVSFAQGTKTQTPIRLTKPTGVANGGLPRHKQDLGASIRTMVDPKELALWKWANVQNLDNFFAEAYMYYTGKGLVSIILSRVLNMSTIMFVVVFSTYLGSCIDYSKIKGSRTLDEVHVKQCYAKLGSFHVFVLWTFFVLWFMKLFQYVKDIRRLVDMKSFYQELLEIDENELQTISWPQVAKRMATLSEANAATQVGNSTKQRIEPHDIANRVMRKENYLVAMFHKRVLNMTVPLPQPLQRIFGRPQLLSRALEWNLSLCILDYVFNPAGQVRPMFLKSTHKQILSTGLRRRFVFAAIMNVVFAPFIILYLALLYFFRYFNEYHKNPASIGTRRYNPLAEWKLREYNELPHQFERRLTLSYIPASKYLDQFPKEKTALVSKFVSFIAGSFAAVLGIASLIDPELFLMFEISANRTVLFYIGVFGSILAVSRSLIPEETLVFDPEISLRYVAEFTHYLPPEWEGKLHTEQVKNEFSLMYEMRLIILLKELASIFLAPFILYYSLTQSCDDIVDFIRDHSVHVDGLGYVCTFAMFDFKQKSPDHQPDEDQKMLKSYLYFMDHYGDKPTNVSQTQQNVPMYSSVRLKNDGLDLNNSIMQKFQKHNGHHALSGLTQQDVGLSPAAPTATTATSGTATGAAPRRDLINFDVDESFIDQTTSNRDMDNDEQPKDKERVVDMLNQFYKKTDNMNLGA
ncbi:autophagy-related protein 9 [Yarrowia lipolytica]|uniref:Autophagy-related protein 9 n=1 Tax=Yarrowia lipolytica TaxID=4952 RepID=A0A371CE11_YARLL|nr:autophagy-related protein 9 [Yarrowia lipolytica]RDW34955.1 autophagy-related protein 9 [Yarrowia lipolytica]RDW42723.1 autophagy-related protein 9 [Yarrowia lipolytica]RDW43694.1 autophagy-related protein 9 [Yarrowia lipolytica]RDW55283.1 autophagy-related protein 9 [Yarrowia lipolytica]